MLIDGSSLDLVFRGFKTVYTDAYTNADVNWDKIAMKASSSGSDETYGWLGQFPQLREWIGQRVIQNLSAHHFTIRNRKFESTVAVPRTDIADDKLGVFKPAFSEMGHLAKTHPEELIFDLLSRGFSEKGFDGVSFFNSAHPQKDKDGKDITVSNTAEGASGNPAWFLLDTSRAVRPIIWQEREPYEFTSLTESDNPHVFMNDEYIYGVRARVNAGFGLWQLAYGSTEDLTTETYAAARAAMMNYRADGGRKLGIKPTTLVVPPDLEWSALSLLNSETEDGGASNPYQGTAKLIVTPYLAN